jgi:hypothetical protein
MMEENGSIYGIDDDGGGDDAEVRRDEVVEFLAQFGVAKYACVVIALGYPNKASLGRLSEVEVEAMVRSLSVLSEEEYVYLSSNRDEGNEGDGEDFLQLWRVKRKKIDTHVRGTRASMRRSVARRTGHETKEQFAAAPWQLQRQTAKSDLLCKARLEKSRSARLKIQALGKAAVQPATTAQIVKVTSTGHAEAKPPEEEPNVPWLCYTLAVVERATFAAGVACDLLVAQSLLDQGHKVWGYIVAGLVAVPYLVLWAMLVLLLLRAIAVSFLNICCKHKEHVSCCTMLAYLFAAPVAVPLFVLVDLRLMTWNVGSNHKQGVGMPDWLRLFYVSRRVSGAWFHAFFQIAVQSYLWKTQITNSGLAIASLVFSVCSFCKLSRWSPFHWETYTLAQDKQSRLFMTHLARHGQARTPHLDGIKDGTVTEAQYCRLTDKQKVLSEWQFRNIVEAIQTSVVNYRKGCFHSGMSINFYGNMISAKALSYFCDKLWDTKILSSLVWDANDLGVEGALVLSSFVRHNKSLRSLSLLDTCLVGLCPDDEKIGVWSGQQNLEGVLDLADALKNNVGLLELNLGQLVNMVVDCACCSCILCHFRFQRNWCDRSQGDCECAAWPPNIAFIEPL